MNHANMSVEDLRNLAGSLDTIANLVADLAHATGAEVKIDLTGPPLVSFPLFPVQNQNPVKSVSPAIIEQSAPKPTADQEPVKKPEPQKVAYDKLPVGTNGGAWTDAEDLIVMEHVAANPGMSINAVSKLIATKIDRTFGAISFRIKNALADDLSGQPEPIKPVEPVDVAAKPPANKAFPDFPEPAEQPAWAKPIHAHLNALGYPGDWNPQLDFDMLDRLGRGEKFGTVAALLEIEKPAALARYNAIIAGALDDNGKFSFEAQTRLTSILRDRAKVTYAA